MLSKIIKERFITNTGVSHVCVAWNLVKVFFIKLKELLKQKFSYDLFMQ